MERRVVITACSAITPIGHGKDQIVASLLKGISGVKTLREDQFISGFIHSKVYGTVDYPVDYDFKRQYRKTMGPVAYYACQVAKEVLEQSGLPEDFITSGRGLLLVPFMVLRPCSGIFIRSFLKQRIKPHIRASVLLII
jgi:3-oxoacyl-[acyl-carrier-protein] synthase II